MIEIVNDQETEIRIEIEVTEMIKSGIETEIGVIITDWSIERRKMCTRKPRQKLFLLHRVVVYRM